MFKKIVAAYPLEGHRLLVWFEGGDVRSYDARPLLRKAPFAPLKDEMLFGRVRVDAGGYGISWSDDIDLAGNELFDGGEEVDVKGAERSRIVAELAHARKQRGLTQSQLEEASGVRQPIIARMEKGDTSPQLDTMIRVLAPLGKTLKVVDLV